ncbi:MAG: ArdC family protein [Leptospirales bacterium]
MGGDDNERQSYRQKVTDDLIRMIKENTAPWQRPWDSSSVFSMPHNPVSNVQYRGMNSLWLMSRGGDDPRWMTYKQAEKMGWQVKKGERGTQIEYWKWHDGKTESDPGTNETTAVSAERRTPQVFHATVFNARQIEGIPPMDHVAKPTLWTPIERVEAILKNSGAGIHHDGGDRAYYSPSSDSIHLPPRSSFGTERGYYGTALHELGHWTGHANRLNRDLAGGFGSENYAREELRAEIGSYFLAIETGIPHDPGHHASYVDSWVSALRKDPHEIFRASREAGRIADYVMTFDLVRLAERDFEQKRPVASEERETLARTFLVAPRKKAEGDLSPDYTGLVVIGKSPHKVDLWEDGQIQIARSDPDRFTAVGGGRLAPSGPGEMAGTIPVQTDRNVRTSVGFGIRGVGDGSPVRLSVSERRIERTENKTRQPERGIS